MRDYVAELMAEVKAKNPAEPEFHQAVQEVLDSLIIVLEQHPEYRREKILQRIIEQGKTAKKLGYDPKYCAYTMVDLHALMEQHALENPYPS